MPPKAPASRKSTGAITTTTTKTRVSDRRKSAPAPAAAEQGYDADMPPPSSQRSEGDSQERLKTAAKSAKDNFRATADRCASIRESVEQAEEDISAVNMRLVQNCAKKEATFLKALQAHLNTISRDFNPTRQPQPSTSTNSLTHLKARDPATATATNLLTLCASLTTHYHTTQTTLSHAQTRLQTPLAIGATWSEDQAVLIDTLKGGARIVDRRNRSLTNEEVDGIGLTVEEDTVVQLLKLNEAIGTGHANVHEVMKDAKTGLKRMTKGLPESAGEDVDMVM